MAAELDGRKILIVDDDPDIMTAITTVFEEMGADLITATDGNMAVTRAQEHKPELVILDMMLPKRSGFLVLENIKRLGADSDSEVPKVIMITGNPGSRHKVYAQAQGVDIYINKPFRMENLIVAVKKLLGLETSEAS